MDEDLYDEFGNYIGPDVSDDEEEDDAGEMWEGGQGRFDDEEDVVMGGDSPSAGLF